MEPLANNSMEAENSGNVTGPLTEAEFEKLPVVNIISVGDHIAYKTIEMTPQYTPEIVIKVNPSFHTRKGLTSVLGGHSSVF
jgi:hypothetical protein